MRKLVLITGVFALAACAGEAEAPAEEAVEEVAVEEATVDMSGTYERTDEEGVARSTTMNADGTWVSYADGEQNGEGTWTADAENGTCFTDAEPEEGAEPACFTTGDIAEDGTMEVTNPDGETYTVTKTS